MVEVAVTHTNDGASDRGRRGGSDEGAQLDEAHQGFSRSIMISGIRCVLTYVILPFVTPLIGLAPGVGPVVGLVIGTVAIVANVFSIRRFWRADHRWKIHATVLHGAVIVLLLVLLYLDLAALLT